MPDAQELLAPHSAELNPHVIVTPIDFHYSIDGSMKTWSSFGEWESKLIEGLDILPYNEKQKVHKLVKGALTSEEKIKRLYNYLQDNHRYVYVGLDDGGLKPYPASYVCKNRFGDCKALTNYMKALLNEIGIEAYYTSVYAGKKYRKVDNDLPAQQFNHVILAVPLEGDTIWLENTSSTLPFNYLGTFTQNRKVLLANRSESKLVNTPKLTLDEVVEKRSYAFELDDTGSGHCQVDIEGNGSSFEVLNSLYKQLNSEDQQEKLKERYRLGHSELASWAFKQQDRNIPNISLHLSYNVAQCLNMLGKSSYIHIPPFPIADLEKPSDREHLVRISYPTNREDILTWNIPLTSEREVQLPEDIKLETEFGRFEANYLLLDEQIIMKRSFQLFAGEYDLDHYPSFYDFIRRIEKNQKQVYILFK